MNGTRKRVADIDRVEADDEMSRRFDAGESITSDDDEVVTLDVKVPLDHVIPVRLTAEKWRALHREAKELGVGPTTLARMWLLEKLRAVEAPRSDVARVAEEKMPYVGTRPNKAAAKTPPTRSPAKKVGPKRKTG